MTQVNAQPQVKESCISADWLLRLDFGVSPQVQSCPENTETRIQYDVLP